MYQDAYAECNVAKKSSPYTGIFSVIMIAMCAISLIAGFLLSPLMLVIFLVLLVMTYFFRLNSDIEYEYLYVSGELDFDIIKQKQRRKRLLDVSMDNVIVIAPENHDAARAYAGRSLHTVDYSSHTDATRFVLAYKDSKSNEERLVLFEPDDKMISTLRSAAPSKVHTTDYN